MHVQDWHGRARGRVSAAILFLLPLLAFPLLAGCARRVVPVKATVKAASATNESLDAARETLRKDADNRACLSAVQQLNTHLTRSGDPRWQERLAQGKDEAEQMARQLRFDADETAEVTSPTFTSLDAHHLDLCFLMRDAVRSLDLDGLTPREQAEAAFAWMVRQVHLHEEAAVPAPPQFVLRRNWGTALERTLVFLAALDQLGLDGCLVMAPADKEKQGPRAWLVAVLIDGCFLLFDPGLGMPLPGAKGTAMLAELRARPDLLRALTVDPKAPYPVSPEQVKEAKLMPVFSLGALAPRMKYLEDVLGSANKVRLASDPLARLERLRAAAKAQGVSILTAQEEGLGAFLSLVQRRFVPVKEGGADKTDRLRRFVLDMIPIDKIPAQVDQLPGELKDRVRFEFYSYFVTSIVNPDGPREQMLRGRFDEATHTLLEKRGKIETIAEQMKPNLQEDVAGWSRDMIEASALLLNIKKRTPREQWDKDPDVLAAQARADQIWQNGTEKRTQLLLNAAGNYLAGETTYLLGLCKQEQAERLQARLDRLGTEATEKEGEEVRKHYWEPAIDWWESIATEYPTTPSAAAARGLHARALIVLGEPKKAASLLEDLSGNLSPLDKTGRLYRARQLRGK